MAAEHVLITGGASGLGEALALHYAANSAQVCIADINPDGAQQVLQKIKDAGGSAFFLPCDITSQEDVDNLANEIKERWGELDILINNAGVATGGALEFEDIEQWQWVIDINVLGMVRMTRAFVPMMKAQDKATIINIASQAGITPISFMGSYNASKAAVVSFSETMHIELAKDNIQVSVVCPSFFPTNLGLGMRSAQPGVQQLVSKLLSRSDITAEQVAHIIYVQAKAGKFMILTHKLGRQAYRLKRFLPTKRYMKMMKQKMAKFGPRT
ncbi:MAG: NAD(P)-dependent dehydrogenase (short-subunit alcohol dehydrogenase family) [Paraglaciecola sp.]|jgi:NAD(P)-dependent dehydrogenase (short-subunit alcohol dehydrogenase family)